MEKPEDQNDLYIENFLDLLKADQTINKKLKIINLLNHDLPSWFIPMLNDTKRNNFYEKMIKEHVKNKTVLEIGAGVGLWGLAAAEYGAKHIYACELNPLMYCLAKKNIEASPYAKKISLFFAHSDTLEIEKQLPHKVDIILSELISSDVFSENMVPTLKNAKKLLKKNGIYLPTAISAYGCLIELQDELPSKINSAHPAFSLIKDLTADQSTYLNLNLYPFNIISKPLPLFSLADGYKISPELPLEFTIEKNTNIKSKSTYFCVYFAIHNGKKKLVNLDLKNKKNLCHWENIVWKLDNKKSSYKFKLLNQEERLILLDQ